MKKIIIEICNSIYDLHNFLKYSFDENKLRTKEEYIASLTKQYHTIEKALALPSPRIGFGEKKHKFLLNDLKNYIKIYGNDNISDAVISSFYAYINFNNLNNHSTPFIYELKNFINNHKNNKLGGIDANYFINENINEFEIFFKSRKSLRNFNGIDVPDELLYKAVDIAKYTPSVCNRQGWHIYNFKGDIVKKLLYLQSGNIGFTDEIKTLSIVTGETQYFSYKERNQISIDSGMFSMSYILALHSLGLGTCPLNMCISLKIENKIKALANIPKSSKIIMYIAVGYPEKNSSVAKSYRRNTNSFLTNNTLK